MLLRFGIDDVEQKMPRRGKMAKRVLNQCPSTILPGKRRIASAEVGFPMLIGAGKNGQKTIVRGVT